MNLSDFDFFLLASKIAQNPLEQRDDSKMMVLKRKDDFIINSKSYNFINYINENYFLVFNDTKVRKARVFDKSKKNEFLFVNKIDDNTFECMCKKLAKKKINEIFVLQGDIEIQIIDKNEEFIKIKSDKPIYESYFEKYGHMPLPPYIKREDNIEDTLSYQPVFSKNIGSIASPTASLHFEKDIFKKLETKKIGYCFVTLHVGLGTFLPVKSTNILEHKMHYETYSITKQSADKINEAKKSGKKILGIGTTSIRTLESIYQKYSCVKEIENEQTNLFIYPGYDFKIVDSVFTNFHTPKSTLLMLVSAFYGYQKTMKVYNYATSSNYRFFSYGDCMLIL